MAVLASGPQTVSKETYEDCWISISYWLDVLSGTEARALKHLRHNDTNHYNMQVNYLLISAFHTRYFKETASNNQRN